MRKIKKIWSKLFHKTLPVNCPPKDYLKVTEINESEYTHDGLGVSEDRLEYLHKLCAKSYREGADKERSIIYPMEIISKECTHANELFLCSVLIMSIHNSHRHTVTVQLGKH